MRRIAATVIVGAMAANLLSADAFGQGKPPPAGGPQAPATEAPAPTAPPTAPPMAPSGKFDKFATPPAAPQQPAPQQPPPQSPPQQQAAPAAPPIPANEPAIIGRLRSLLADGTVLTYAAQETVDAARGSVRLRGVTLRSAKGPTTTAEELVLEGLRDNGITDLQARSLRTDHEGSQVHLAQLRISGLTMRAPAAGQAWRPDLLSLDSLRIEGLRMVDAQGEATATSLELSEIGPDRASQATLAGLEIRPAAAHAATTAGADHIRIARIALRGVNATALLGALLDETSPGMPSGRQALELDDLVVNGGGKLMGALASLRLASDTSNGASTGSVALRGLRVEPFPAIASWLRDYGYGNITADFTAETRFNAATGRLEVPSISLAARDVGALALSFVLDQLGADLTDPNAYDRARLVAAGLRYVDQSIYGRVVRQQAQQGRVQEGQLREQFAAMATVMLGAKASQALQQAVGRFLRGQARELEITARPAQPLPLASLTEQVPGDAADAERRFGLTFSAR